MSEKFNETCEIICDDKKKNRFIVKRRWDKNLPVACVITLNPSSCEPFELDLTTMLILNNIHKLGKFGGVDLVNLFSTVTMKLLSADCSNDLSAEKNIDCIVKSAKGADSIIIAWGSAGKTNRAIAQREKEVLSCLISYSDKLFFIGDGSNDFRHPLCPSVRSQWDLYQYCAQNYR